MEKIKVFDEAKQREVVVGELRGFTFYKPFNRQRHYMRMMKGFGLDEGVYQKLREHGVMKIVLKSDTEQLVSDITDWDCMNVRDFGHGKQRFLPEKYMVKVETKAGNVISRETEK